MGSQDFTQTAKGKTAEQAFTTARALAAYDHGHGGYTGSIAEKTDFVLVQPPKGLGPREYAEQLMQDDDERISDKWGPAGCVALGDDKFLFFGWASS